MYYIGSIPCQEADIQHWGIKGMKWGLRRFQNTDGSLTAAGKARYGIGDVVGRLSANKILNRENPVKNFKRFTTDRPHPPVNSKMREFGEAWRGDYHWDSVRRKNTTLPQSRQNRPALFDHEGTKNATSGLHIGEKFKGNTTGGIKARQDIRSGNVNNRFTEMAGSVKRGAQNAASYLQNNPHVLVGAIAGTAAIGVGIYAARRIMKSRKEKAQNKENSNG